MSEFLKEDEGSDVLRDFKQNVPEDRSGIEREQDQDQIQRMHSGCLLCQNNGFKAYALQAHVGDTRSVLW